MGCAQGKHPLMILSQWVVITTLFAAAEQVQEKLVLCLETAALVCVLTSVSGALICTHVLPSAISVLIQCPIVAVMQNALAWILAQLACLLLSRDSAVGALTVQLSVFHLGLMIQNAVEGSARTKQAVVMVLTLAPVALSP